MISWKEDQKPVVNTERLLLCRESRSLPWPEGNLSELRKYIQSLEDEYSACESWELVYDWTGYEDVHYFVKYTAYETDEEMQNRIEYEQEYLREWMKIYNEKNREKNLKAQQEKEARRKQYEALKKEFDE